MNTLCEALQDYLALRRGLGFKMHDAGLLLPRFVAFMAEHQVLMAVRIRAKTAQCERGAKRPPLLLA